MSFHFDLTKYLHPGANTIAVRVNNLLQPAARWYTGSGIYGHVQLITTPRTHIAPWSTFVNTRSIAEDHATIAISPAIDHDAADAQPSQLRFTVLDANQHAATARTVSLAQNTPLDIERPLELTLAHPELWSPDTPSLYTLRTELLDGKRVVDIEETRLEVRTTAFDLDKGFLMNGKVLKLSGVGDHLYGGPMGTAIPDGILERRLRLLKSMGVNAIRTAHNSHTPYFYDLCGRIGILVMDEIYDGWHKKVKTSTPSAFTRRNGITMSSAGSVATATIPPSLHGVSGTRRV